GGWGGGLVKAIRGGGPFSLIVRQVELPKQPAWGGPSWPVQNRPVELVALAGQVVSGERLMGITPTCTPSQQLPPPVGTSSYALRPRGFLVQPAVRTADALGEAEAAGHLC